MKHLVTPTQLLTAIYWTALNAEQANKQICRNKCRILIVPLPKVLEKFQLVFGWSVFINLLGFFGGWEGKCFQARAILTIFYICFLAFLPLGSLTDTVRPCECTIKHSLGAKVSRWKSLCALHSSRISIDTYSR